MNKSEDVPSILLRIAQEHRDGITVADARTGDFPVLYVNRGFELMTGYRPADVVGKNCRFLQGEHDNTQARERIRRALDTGTDCRVILRNNRKDGTPFWNELTLFPLRDKRGEIAFVVGVQHDVTERVDAERAAQRAAQRFREMTELVQAINRAPDKQRLFQMIARYVRTMFAAQRTSITLLNDSGQSFDIYALTEEERVSPLAGSGIPLAGTAIAAITRDNRILNTPDLRESPFREHGQLAQAGMRSCLQGPLAVGDRVIGSLNMGKDAAAGFTDEDVALLPQVTALIASDIERRRLTRSADVATAQSAQIQRFADRLALLNQLGNALSGVDTEDQIFQILADQLPAVVAFQRGQLSLHSKSDDSIQAVALESGRARVVGRRLLAQNTDSGQIAAIHWQRRGHPQHLLDRSQGSSLTAEVRFRDQHFGWLEVVNATLQPYAESDVQLLSQTAAFVASTLQNVRMLHRLKAARREAEASSASKSAFLANMSHEIRTPLNAIIGMATLLSDTGLNKRQRHFVDTVEQSGDALLRIVNDILDVSKIEADQLILEIEPFYLRTCLENALDLVTVKAAEKGIELAYFVPSSLPDRLCGDALRLQQVLVNLLHNAVKFTDSGEVTLTATGQPVSDNDADGDGPLYDIQISVKDTGPGIPASHLDGLFEPFSQIDVSTTRKFGGTGLGLTICKQLCRLMGGRIWVESEVGVGSTFHITCRMRQADDATERDHPKLQLLYGLKVLIVDDSTTNREILGSFTSDWGMLPQMTGSPVEALSWIHSGRSYDLAILDMHMPEMNGIALASVLRQIESSRDTPIMLLGSLNNESQSVKSKLHELGISVFLTKPIKRSQLLNALLQAVHGDVIRPDSERSAESQFDSDLGRTHPLRILVAEDNQVNRDVIRALLERFGYAPEFATDGLEVLAALEQSSYDVVLMDLHMPELDGLSTTRRIRARPEWRERPYIIAVTANVMLEHRKQCLTAGMNDFLSKPIRVPALKKVLLRHRERSTDVALERKTAHKSIAEFLDDLLADIGGNVASMKGLLQAFEDSIPPLIDSIERAGRESDLDGIQQIAHELHSSSAGLGAHELAGTCAQLELAAERGDEDRCHEELARVRAQFDSALAAMRSYARTLPP